MEKLNTTEIGKKDVIGINRYNFLKSLLFDDLTELEKQECKDYEERNNPDPEQIKKLIEYREKVRNPEPEKEFIFDKKTMWKSFLKSYKEVNDVDFEQNNETLENVKTLFMYFLKDDNFFFCKNLSSISKPSFDKGLLIIGNFGNGKTSVMKAFDAVFKGIKNYGFNSYSANAVVTMFESIKNDDLSTLSKADFERKMNYGVKYFDDVKTEREASNFGKVNLFKDILESREKNNAKTYVTCNFKQGYPNDIEQALNEFEDKYGSRVYDRLFKMFNVVVFNGKSFRL